MGAVAQDFLIVIESRKEAKDVLPQLERELRLWKWDIFRSLIPRELEVKDRAGRIVICVSRLTWEESTVDTNSVAMAPLYLLKLGETDVCWRS